VQELGYSVALFDNNPVHVRAAREEGLTAHQGNALSENILDEITLSGIGYLLITIPNDEVASLTALHFSEVFESTDIYQLAAQPDSRHGGEGVMPGHLRGRPLFGEDTSYQSLKAHVERGDNIEVLSLSDNATDETQEYYSYDDLSNEYEDATVIPLFILRENDTLEIVSETNQFRLLPEDEFVALVGTGADIRDQDHKTPTVEQTEGDGLLEVEESAPEPTDTGDTD
jgi:hypothetical protein